MNAQPVNRSWGGPSATQQNHHQQPQHHHHQNSTASKRSGILADDNDALANELCVKVNSLRELSLNLGEEVRTQNTFLDDQMSGLLARSEGMLRAAMRRVGLIRRSEGGLGGVCGLYCQLLAFALFFFLLCWLLLKFA